MLPFRRDRFQKIGHVMMGQRTLSMALTPGFAGDLKKSFGPLWESVHALKIDGTKLVLLSHPALRMMVRMRRREILDPLKGYGISDIMVLTS